jgi:hypothetical protein
MLGKNNLAAGFVTKVVVTNTFVTTTFVTKPAAYLRFAWRG